MIAVTIGDPAGIGPAVVAKAIKNKILAVSKLVVIGDKDWLERYGFKETSHCRLWHVPSSGVDRLLPGKPQAAGGSAAVKYLRAAVSLAKNGEIQGIVTAPVSKEALVLSGISKDKPGQTGYTELLADICRVRNVEMLMVAGHMRAVLCTRHIPLSKVPALLTKERIIQATVPVIKFLRDRFGIPRPKAVLCALNPHAGEGGHVGQEEKKTLTPALKYLTQHGFDVTGPMSSDSAFLKLSRGEYDLAIALYHDQAMLPLKALYPHRIVNVTVGLPFVRTAPGHGTAYDLARKKYAGADPGPMIEAIVLASQICYSKG